MKPSGANTRGALWRLTLSGVVAVILLIAVANSIMQPVNTKTSSHTAEFTDVSGLHTGADVRLRGVRIGKVDRIQLEHDNGRSVAVVDFMLEEPYGVGPDTRLAVKYQTLTGERYLDAVSVPKGTTTNMVSRIPTSMTQPSFDVTTLFNGLQPVLATLSPDEINTFTENAVAYLSGDGNGLGPMLDSIRKLTSLASDRQQVIATLTNNLAHAADALGGDAPQFVSLLELLRQPLDALLEVLDEFRKTDMYGPDFVAAADTLLDHAGFGPDINADDALDRAITNVHNNIEAFKRLPVLWDNIPEPSDEGVTPAACSQGAPMLPPSVDVLLNGQKVVLCKG